MQTHLATLLRLFPLRVVCLITALATATSVPAANAEGPLGRWALTLPTGDAGWLELVRADGWYDGSILWSGGSVLPLENVVIEGDTATLTRITKAERKGPQGKVLRTQQLVETLIARADGDNLSLVRVVPRRDGSGFDRTECKGKRIPPLPAKPDLASVKYSAPIQLFNGRDTDGWRLTNEKMPNAWVAEKGVLSNRPPKQEGKERIRYGNLRTNREFEDFNLKLDVKVPEHSNSGIYLRGIYEVQILDSYGKPLDSHNMGALYSRITPSMAAEKPANEWQTLDMTLVARHLTVILNGKTIIENQPILGCTGGAMWSDEFRPGPIFLQGDHGAVEFRNIVLRPVLK